MHIHIHVHICIDTCIHAYIQTYVAGENWVATKWIHEGRYKVVLLFGLLHAAGDKWVG